jgi:phage-related protein (TIGR01555 family)
MKKKNKKELKNGLTSLATSMANEQIFPDIPAMPLGINPTLGTAPIQSANPMFYNNRYYMITNMRTLLNEMYIEHGIIQTMIDQPVEDGFRGGFKIISSELSNDEIIELEKKIEETEAVEKLIEALKWNRLFGGAGVIINVAGEDPRDDFDIEVVGEGREIEFYSADRWELANNPYILTPTLTPNGQRIKDINFNYYGIEINPSRVLILRGKPAPSLKRQQLQGWGMSELERLVSPMNKFLKNQNVIYELLDEAKLDVYSIDNYAGSVASGQEEAVKKRIMLTNFMKSYLNALILDSEDKFDQKQMSMSGVSEVLREARYDIASAMKMPVTKIFGMSSAGFNSGDDDIENYNSMIERDVRTPAKNIIKTIIRLLCKSTFDYIPEDIDIEFESLRIMKETEEEALRTSKYNRFRDLYINGLITKGEFYDLLSQENVIQQELKIKGDDEYYSMLDGGASPMQNINQGNEL